LGAWVYYSQLDCQDDWHLSVDSRKYGLFYRVGNQYFSIPPFPVINKSVLSRSRNSVILTSGETGGNQINNYCCIKGKMLI